LTPLFPSLILYDERCGTKKAHRLHMVPPCRDGGMALQPTHETRLRGHTEMKLTAKDVMVEEYTTVRPDAPVSEAARLIFAGAVRATGYKPFGIMVTDEFDRLQGVISMVDILYHLRPPFMNYEMEKPSIWEGEIEPYMEQFSDLKVEQVMSAPVVTADPADHLIVVIDRMVKTGARRLPVLEEGRIVGIVYLSDVFHRFCQSWLKPAASE